MAGSTDSCIASEVKLKMATENIFLSAGTETSEKTTPKSATHLIFLDGLRAFAALYVVFHHCVGHIKMPTGIVYAFFSTIFSKGHFAVDVFIVLSGFCLMLPHARDNRLRVQTGNFIKKRLRRILPTYYLAMLFSLVLIYTIIGTPSGTHWDASIPVTKWDLFTHLTLIQDIFNSTNVKINHTFWSIAVEFKIYFLFPLIVTLFRITNPVMTTIGTLLMTVGAWGVLTHFPTFNLSPWGINPHYLGLFTIGMLSAHLAYSTRPLAIKIKESNLLMLVPVILAILAFKMDASEWGLWMAADIAVGLACACLLIGLTAGKFTSIHKLLSWKPIAFTGVFAYSIYLIHAPLLEVFSRYFVDVLHLSTTAAVTSFIFVGAPLVIGCSYLFYRIAEKPFIRKKVSSRHG
jgi:peptidoglycan/LPS O-acetylase OafA/YrhL